MKKRIKFLATLMAIYTLFITNTSSSLATNIKPNVAVVDIQKVVSTSSEVNQLKQEQINQTKKIENWLETVKDDVNKQTTNLDKQKTIEKYKKQFEKKRELNQKNYITKLKLIDKNISNTIANQAKANGYDIVLSKSMVLVGGDDITAEIEKAIK